MFISENIHKAIYHLNKVDEALAFQPERMMELGKLRDIVTKLYGLSRDFGMEGRSEQN
jgi:hypothetical protein